MHMALLFSFTNIVYVVYKWFPDRCSTRVPLAQSWQHNALTAEATIGHALLHLVSMFAKIQAYTCRTPFIDHSQQPYGACV